MSKSTRIIMVLLIGVLAAEIYFAARWWLGRSAGEYSTTRRAPRDEDAPPPSEPALSVAVNGESPATVVAGGPLYLAVSLAHRHAANVESKLRLLEARAARLAARNRDAASAAALAQTRTAIAAHQAAAKLSLGEPGHAWTGALRVTLRPLPTGPAAPWPLVLLGPPAATPLVLDAETALEAHLAPSSSDLAPGAYEALVCLEATGAWKGRACSGPARFSVVASGAALNPAQRDRLDRQAARQALLSANWPELQRLGQLLLVRDKVAGHTALGDAAFGQQRWQQALDHYTAARAAYPRGPAAEPPRDLNIRISRLLDILEPGI